LIQREKLICDFREEKVSTSEMESETAGKEKLYVARQWNLGKPNWTRWNCATNTYTAKITKTSLSGSPQSLKWFDIDEGEPKNDTRRHKISPKYVYQWLG